MTTDPGLPLALTTAAARVSEVGQQLTSVVTALNATAIRAQLGWSGPSAQAWARGCSTTGRALAADAAAAHALADTLRRAASAAGTRVELERRAAAALERQRAEAAERARKAGAR